MPERTPEQGLDAQQAPKGKPTLHVIIYGDGDWETMMMCVGDNCEGWGLHTLQEILEDLQENCPDDLYASGEYTIQILGYKEPEQVAENYSHPGYWEYEVLSFQQHTYDTPEFQEGTLAFLQAVKALPEFDWADTPNFWANRQKRDDLLQEARTQCPYPEGRQKQCWQDGWDSQKDVWKHEG